MNRELQEYLDNVMIFANRNEKDAIHLRVELEDHLLQKVTELEASGLEHTNAISQAIKDFGGSKRIGYSLRTKYSPVKIYFLVVTTLFVANYFLLLGRFYWFGCGTLSTWIYKVINFPLSVLYLWFERKRNPWWYEVFGRRFEYLLNDEFGPFLLFIITIVLQAILITSLILWFRRLRGQKKSRGFSSC